MNMYKLKNYGNMFPKHNPIGFLHLRIHWTEQLSERKTVASIHGVLYDELAVETPSKKIKKIEQTQNESVDKTHCNRSIVEAAPVDQSNVYVNFKDRDSNAPALDKSPEGPIKRYAEILDIGNYCDI